MTNINEVMDRLSGLVAEPDLCREPLNVIKDLKALLSYTKQCREALTDVMEWVENWDPNFIYDPEWPETNERARQALSTQPGERE